ncbi:MAG: DUF4252 domain-containing protein [Candidatus Cryptobacteroides sp.]
MKKSIYTIAATACIIIMCGFTSAARSASEGVKQSIENVIDSYRGNENFEVVKIGGWMMKLAGAKECSSAKINSMIVVDYSDCTNNVKSGFTVDVLKAAKGCSKLMEVQEGNEKVTFLGTVSEDGSTISNPMILTDDGELVCFFGTINANELGNLRN